MKRAKGARRATNWFIQGNRHKYRTCEKDHRELETNADEAVDEHHLVVILEIMD